MKIFDQFKPDLLKFAENAPSTILSGFIPMELIATAKKLKPVG
jgi:hypothetical protein